MCVGRSMLTAPIGPPLTPLPEWPITVELPGPSEPPKETERVGFDLLRVVAYNLKGYTLLLQIFLDVDKAFDSAPRQAIFQGLQECGVDGGAHFSLGGVALRHRLPG